VKFLVGQMLDQLRKHGAARVHPALLPLPPPSPSSVSGLNEFKSFPATKPLIPPPVSRLRQHHAIFPGQQWHLGNAMRDGFLDEAPHPGFVRSEFS